MHLQASQDFIEYRESSRNRNQTSGDKEAWRETGRQ